MDNGIRTLELRLDYKHTNLSAAFGHVSFCGFHNGALCSCPLEVAPGKTGHKLPGVDSLVELLNQLCTCGVEVDTMVPRDIEVLSYFQSSVGA